MDTLKFLRAILPSQGVHYLGIMRNGQQGVAHKAFDSIDDMAAAVAAFDRNPNVTLYHACGTYKEPFVVVEDKDGKEKKKYRIASNALAAQAFWIDIDVGEDKAEKNKGYATKNAGWAAVAGFCKTVGLPLPLVVDSGGGLHCYWPLTSSLPASEWRSHAAKLKAILVHFAVYADPTRTADFASVLRPVGSLNKKYDPPKPVKVIREAGPFDTDEIIDTLDAIMEANDIETEVLGAPPAASVGANSDLTAHGFQGQDMPTDANKMADNCHQVAMMRDTRGDVDYEHWRGVIGLLTVCEDGREIAVEWSALRADTGHGQTDAAGKYDTWNSPPTTCEFFAKVNPTGCEGCPHKGKIKTPLVLGRVEPKPAGPSLEQAVMDGMEVQIEVPSEVNGYRWVPSGEGGQMVRYKPGKDGMLEAHPFANHRFYPVARICQPDGKFQLRVRVHLPRKQAREFDIPTSLVSVGGSDLARAMGEYEITPVNEVCMPHMTAYMKAQLERLLVTTHEMTTMTSFGWKDDMSSFLIGDRLYMADGTVRKVMLGGLAHASRAAFPVPKGSAAGWSEGIDFIYNRPNMECMQYTVCSGFGSLLSPFGENYKGVPLALTSEKSGRGKTTACRAALYAFGSVEYLQVNGKDGSTINSRGGLMGAYNNIPMLVDEITHIKADELSALLYAASNGKDKIRMSSKGGNVTLAESYTWSMSMYMTANKHLAGALAAAQVNSKAEANRIIELRVDDYHAPELDPMLVDKANRMLEANSGSAGELYIKWLAQNVKDIEKRFKSRSDWIMDAVPLLQNNEYRYFRQHAVCTLTAAEIMIELGLVKFDLAKLEQFTTEMVVKLIKTAQENNETSNTDALSQLINSMSSTIIATDEYRKNTDSRGPEEVRMNQEPTGRYIRGTNNPNVTEPLTGRLYLSKKAMKQWCLDNRVDLDALLREARGNGWLIDEPDDRFLLGRGTNIVTSQVRCFAFNLALMQGEAHHVNQSLRLISGDKEA